jgi:hypothetical protein
LLPPELPRVELGLLQEPVPEQPRVQPELPRVQLRLPVDKPVMLPQMPLQLLKKHPTI